MQYPGNLIRFVGLPVLFGAYGRKEVAMDRKKRGHVPEDSMKQCIFRAKNCQMEDDGTWDCSTHLKDCFGVHSHSLGPGAKGH